MRQTQSGKGFIPILLLIIGAIVVVVIVANNSNLFKNNSSNDANPTAGSEAAMPQASGVVELMLDPAVVSAQAAGTFSLNVKVDPKTEGVSAVDLKLVYDPDYLEATLIKGTPSLPLVLAPGKVTSGSATIVVGLSNPAAPVKEVDTIATVTFKAKKAGMTNVTVDNSSEATAIGKKGNVLGPSTAASVTIK